MNAQAKSMNGLLSGVKILDLSNLFGAYGTRIMAQQGADVIKVEPVCGDQMRHMGPFADDESDNIEKSLVHNFFNEGKMSITLDYTRPEGRQVFLKLAKRADVVVETFKPGYMKELELDYDVLKEVNPKIIICSITAFSQIGPYASYRATSDIIPFAMFGPMMEYGFPDREPLQIGSNILADAVGMMAVAGISAALYSREESGCGDHISISMSEVAGSWRNMALGIPQMDPEHKPFVRMGSQGSFIPANYYNCKDGDVYIMASGKWSNVVKWLKDEGIDIGDKEDPKYLPDDGYNKYLWADADNVNAMINELASHYTKLEMMEEGQRRGVPVGTSETPDTVMKNPHFIARDIFHTVESPVIGSYKTTVPAKTLPEMDMAAVIPAPLLGQDDIHVFRSIGLTDEEIDRLKDLGIVRKEEKQ